MKKLIWCLATVILSGFSTPVLSQPEPEPNYDTVCTQTACRDGGYTVLIVTGKQEDGSVIASGVSVPRSPYVLEDGSLLILPGETIVYSLEIEGSRVKATFLRRYYPEYPHVQGENYREDWTNPADDALPELEMNEANHPVLGPDQFMISYGQVAGEEGKPDTFMHLWHNFSGMIKPELVMQVFTEDGLRFVSTSSCPMLKRVSSYEHWPHGIGAMIVNSLTLPDTEEMICE